MGDLCGSKLAFIIAAFIDSSKNKNSNKYLSVKVKFFVRFMRKQRKKNMETTGKIEGKRRRGRLRKKLLHSLATFLRKIQPRL